MVTHDEEVCFEARRHGAVLARPLAQARGARADRRRAAGRALAAAGSRRGVDGGRGRDLPARGLALGAHAPRRDDGQGLPRRRHAPAARGDGAACGRSRTSSWSRACPGGCSATARWSPGRSRSTTFPSRAASTGSSSGWPADGRGGARRGSGADEAVRLDDGGRRSVLRGAAWPDHRLPRARTARASRRRCGCSSASSTRPRARRWSSGARYASLRTRVTRSARCSRRTASTRAARAANHLRVLATLPGCPARGSTRCSRRSS